MAIKFNRSQTFATNGTVTAAGLHNLIDGTDIYQALITDQTAMTSVGSLDKLLIADSDLTAGDAPRSVTVNELFEDALTLSTYTNVKAVNSLYTNATGNYTLSTGATITNGTITNGVIPTGTFGTTTSTAATITTGTIPTLTAGTTTSTAANITTGTLANLVATTSTFNGTITGSTNIINIGSGQIYKDASGNVGIGTTTPAGKLDVYNATNVLATFQGDSTTNLVVHRASTDISSPEINLRKSRGSVASPAAVATNDFIGGIRWQAFGGTTDRSVTRIRSQVEAYVSDTDISSNLTFLTSPAGGITPTEKMRIDSAGNVGIGTASPTKKLHVVGPTANGAGNEAILIDANSVQLAVRRESGGGGTIELGTPNNHNLGIFTNGTVGAFFAVGGNVGIGTTAPVNKLDVVGSFGRGVMVEKTADFTLAATENWIIVNKPTTACTVTLPAASSWAGREFTIKTVQSLAVNSASSNIVALNSNLISTSILPATAGSWATLVSSGVYWYKMAGSA